jgi:dienelactone hydrolase
LIGHLYRPIGPGPSPAVVLLHGCGGLESNIAGSAERAWASWLVAEGYVTLLVDSFTSRGATERCTRTGPPMTTDVALDALAALEYLQEQAVVQRERIAVMGWSLGASPALTIAWAQNDRLTGTRAPDRQFRAAIGVYPACPALATVNSPTLLLLGAQDDMTPPAECVAKARRLRQQGKPIEWVVYPGAYHGFDHPHLGPAAVHHAPWGGTLKYDGAATALAQGEVRRFLSAHLR